MSFKRQRPGGASELDESEDWSGGRLLVAPPGDQQGQSGMRCDSVDLATTDQQRSQQRAGKVFEIKPSGGSSQKHEQHQSKDTNQHQHHQTTTTIESKLELLAESSQRRTHRAKRARGRRTNSLASCDKLARPEVESKISRKLTDWQQFAKASSGIEKKCANEPSSTSGDITSDYFSSSAHNSPIVISANAKNPLLKSKRTVIYENPAFATNNDRASDKMMMVMKQTREEEKEEADNKMRKQQQPQEQLTAGVR